MRYFLILLLLLSQFLTASAQKIHFGDLSNKWAVLFDITYKTSGSRRVGYEYTDSTTINGLVFHKLSQSKATPYKVISWYESIYVYEDTVKNMVFVGDTSHILYDFNLQVGDTLHTYYPYNSITHTVINIDTSMINNYPHKVFHCTPNITIVEGIGCLFTPIYPIKYQEDWYPPTKIICFENKGTNPTIDSVYSINLNSINCQNPFLTVTNTGFDSKDITVYPQPAYESANISFPENIQSGECRIYDIVGRQVYYSQISNQQKLKIDNSFGEGIYYYIINDKRVFRIILVK